MNRNTIVLLLVSAVSMIVGVSLFQIFDAPDTSSATVKPSTISLAPIPFVGLDGSKHELGDWQQPVIIVNFWAPWCAPCRREIPALVKIQKQYAEQVQILGLALDSAENVKNFATELQMNYPSFLAGSAIPMYNAAFDNKTGSLPFTAFVDKERKLRYVHTGELTFEEMHEKIVELL